MTLSPKEIIDAAKLGRERKAAQMETCAVFAAALYDVLSAQGVACEMVTASPVGAGISSWSHAVVAVDGRYFDSMGEFSTDIYRKREGIHPSVSMDIRYQVDHRAECFEPDFEDLYTFFVNALTNALPKDPEDFQK